MGLFSIASFLIVTSLGTLYPIYLSYKAIKANDLQALEVLLMYWIVMGSVTALENTFGWAVNWLPFYYEAKTILMLWLTLPQIQGSTFVYVTYLHPFLLEHESEIDALMVEVTQKCKRAGADYLRRMIEKLKELVIGLVASQNSNHHAQSNTQAVTNIEPDRSASVYAFNLLRQFGPAAVAVFQPMQTRTNDHQVPNPVPSYDQIFRSAPNPRSVQPAALSGYQIPEFEPSPAPSQASFGSLGVPGSQALGGRRASSTTGVRMHHSGSGSGMSGYDEIMQDEASGSETEWITSQNRRRTTPKPRASTGQIPDRTLPSEAESLLKRPSRESLKANNPTGPGWWFGWGGRPIEELSKKDD